MSQIAENFWWMIVMFVVAILFATLLFSITDWQRQAYLNNSLMMQQAQKQCNGHLLFYTQEYQTNHPIVVCK